MQPGDMEQLGTDVGVEEQAVIHDVLSALRLATACPDVSPQEWAHIDNAPGQEATRLTTMLLLHARDEATAAWALTYFRINPERRRIEGLKAPSSSDKQALRGMLGELAATGELNDRYTASQVTAQHYVTILRQDYYNEEGRLDIDRIGRLYDATDELEHPVLTRLAALRSQGPKSQRPHAIEAERVIRLMLLDAA